MSSLSSKTNSGSKIELSIVPGKALGPFNLGLLLLIAMATISANDTL
jgi:hypothetical protein